MIAQKSVPTAKVIPFSQLQWIWRACVLIPLAMGAVAFQMLSKPPELVPSQLAWDPALFNDPVFLLLSLLAFTDLSLGLVLPRILKRPNTNQLPPAYCILQWALFEGCGLFGVLLAFVRQDPTLSIPYLALSLGALIKYRPKEAA